ncbi:MAG TPA: NAD-glutamate dehydrogenase [Geminicoccaceae bacterium]|nr:NAD-glutamate dehydrogenase [Geminicoccaceae bacterium]
MVLRGEEQKQELILAVIAEIEAKLTGEEAAQAAAFVRTYYRDVAPADVLSREVQDLYGAALAHLRQAGQRPAGTLKVRVFNPGIAQHGWQSSHTVVEIVNDDMPFLVDSVAMELSRHGLGMHLVIHPIFAVERDAAGRLEWIGDREGAPESARLESFMHIEIDRQSDADVLEALEGDLVRILGDVRKTVVDWRSMRERVGDMLAELEPAAQHLPADDLAEIKAFLEWLADDHFTFLGYSAYALEGEGTSLLLRRVKGSGLGILRAHDDGAPSKSFMEMPLAARLRATEPLPAIAITKANTKSTVHRATYLDFIGVKRYAPDGRVIGEHRLLGLFTSVAYNRSPRFIPLLRRKFDAIVERAGHVRAGHAGKALVNILETYPRDELFQADEDTLFEITSQILYLQDRQQIRLFVRQDTFGRFVSCLLYIPRERYNTTLRERLQSLLLEAFDGSDSEFQAQVTEAVLARIMVIVRTPEGVPDDLDVEALERQIQELSQSWTDRLHAALIEAEGEEEGNRLYRTFSRAFPASYQERNAARAAVPDILVMDRLEQAAGDRLGMTLYRRLEDSPEMVRFKLVRRELPLHLSDALPILENMGLKVLHEEAHPVRNARGKLFSMHDFGMRPVSGAVVDVDAVRDAFQEAFERIWSGAVENDGFNRLILAAGLDAAAVVVLRAYCKYMQQLGTPFSQAYIENTCTTNPALAADLVALFNVRFDPDFAGDRAARTVEIEARIKTGLEAVAILDEDRILRRYLGLIHATTRTNAFQRTAEGGPKAYLSLKLDPARVPEMPKPRPAFEIFVYGPAVEGVHLRGGKVARGGLRWSDRREDFRTEVLGLMKAQMVKNGVIVPVGAKGGFYVKRPPETTERQVIVDEAIRCYKLFLSGLLDITDNQVKGAVVPPPRVVRYDDDDPYLVVAADKGTASFSDVANAVSRDYGFWLDDAFASGGSAGYDHKGMGITARGAWESVKRHFREMGLDPAVDLFTVIGIGDMSGDVFGNGMLLSDRIRLLAAFDHRHIFLDPDPDPASSFAERRRLFALPRSSWDDYDRSLLSAGGEIVSRRAKSVTVSPQVQAALGLDRDTWAPTELISAILEAPVDLWWNGGIGTYVKASSESHHDAQDRANDGLRIDGRELRCKVLVEGGNLGMTQKGRIEAASSGVRLNTDFIDNSAGVDCSDHEVNIKILLGEVVAAGDLTMKQRDALLARMTDEVAALCLRDNTLQNLALSLTEARAADFAEPQARLMRKLERAGRLDRAIEFLPDDAELAERRRAGRGLTRPESAVLLAYAKMTLFTDLLATELPDRPYFAGDLAKYFPRPLRRGFAGPIAEHRLRREIIATWLANSLVNRGLDVFCTELEDETGASLADICLGYVITRDAFALLPLWAAIEDLPREVPAALQIEMLGEARETLVRGTRWFLAHTPRPMRIGNTVATFAAPIATLAGALESTLAASQSGELASTIALHVEAGVAPELARTVAALPYLLAGCDIVTVTRELAGSATGPGVENGDPAGDAPVAGGVVDDPLPVARLYFALDEGLSLSRLRQRMRQAPIRTRWDRMALSGLEDELSMALRALTLAAWHSGIRAETPEAAASRIAAWLDATLDGLGRYRELLAEIDSARDPDLAMLSVVVNSAGKLLRNVVLAAA